MKLYYSPGACSMAPHIVLNELGVKFEAESVNLGTKQVGSADFTQVNPKGYVPALKLDNGQVLTEGAVIMQYLADQYPDKKLIPKFGTPERYQCMEWLNFIASEIHKGMSPLFGADRMMPSKEGAQQLKEAIKGNLAKRFAFLANHLQKNNYLMGSNFSVADAYLFTVLGWTKKLQIDLTQWPALLGFMERVQTRPAVATTMKQEGLL